MKEEEKKPAQKKIEKKIERGKDGKG